MTGSSLKPLGVHAMQVWAVKSYTKSVPVYVQVLQRASLRMIAPFLDPERDVLVSVEQMRHRLLALSCLCPGASTLIGAPSISTLVIVKLVTAPFMAQP